MADKIDPARRSANMAAIRSNDTKPELIVRSLLRTQGIGYRLGKNLPRGALPARPDLVLTKYRTAVFVHGCYWHRHGCSKTTTPSSNTDFWIAKFDANVARDVRANRNFQNIGWRVVTIWECGILHEGDRNALGQALEQFLKNDDAPPALVWPDNVAQ